MILVIRRALGNIHDDPKWRSRFDSARDMDRLDNVVIAPAAAEKRRLRVTSEGGVELGIALESGTSLRDGDVLEFGPEDGRLIVVRIARERLLVLTIEGDDPDTAAERGVRLGHLLGTYRWAAVVRGRRIEVPIQGDENEIRAVFETHNLQGVRYDFVDAETPLEPNLTTDASHRRA